ncbi:conserved hypothetical protein [Candidatus Accumulibacter aalborgensis]|uniref:DUF1015 domain-containing protein n=1 Tax=Candidatus Accumulibacter aalborgensis TaxID=1860102 RepID=A0A1A8XN45_9PROT|nr:DUF1015 family protein [Candidatus Accumulibacter aalborgensis]SBT06066.1 conserved hypothetical protein [Candidatus Accumulibacter aalborgensis]
MSFDPSLIRPFAGLRPRSADAAAVAAPPYDVLSSDEARQVVIDKPLSFLHVSKAEIDLPPEVDHYAPEVYARSAENFGRLIAAGVLCRDPLACYYTYRLTMGEHVQTGLVAVASVAAYDSNRIRKHEYTRPDKEDDRVRQIEALNAQTGPVLLAHPDSAEAERLVGQGTDRLPVADVTAADGIRHTLWTIDDAETITRIGAVFAAMPTLYIADGHHRSAAAARVAAARRVRSGSSLSAEFFLAVIFPAAQMRIMDYNRVVRDLNGLSEESFLAAVGERYTISPSPFPVKPERTGVCGMYLGGRWYRLALLPGRVPLSDPVRRLDVSLLAEQILGPLLGITDLRRDTRIDFVGGMRGAAELERRVNSGEMAVAFAMHPTPMAELMAVADAGLVMPPKSTWFEPKLADGLVSHVLD